MYKCWQEMQHRLEIIFFCKTHTQRAPTDQYKESQRCNVLSYYGKGGRNTRSHITVGVRGSAADPCKTKMCPPKGKEDSAIFPHVILMHVCDEVACSHFGEHLFNVI